MTHRGRPRPLRFTPSLWTLRRLAALVGPAAPKPGGRNPHPLTLAAANPAAGAGLGMPPARRRLPRASATDAAVARWGPAVSLADAAGGEETDE